MIRRILERLGFKVFTPAEYEELTDRIAEFGIFYRSLSEPCYHHNGRTVEVELSDLSKYCHIENCVWEDVKSKIYSQ